MENVGQCAGELLQYLDAQDRSVRYDSRVLFGYMALTMYRTPDGKYPQNFKNAHIDWIKFIQISKRQMQKLGTVDIRTSATGDEFAMLTIEQASIVILFSQFDSSVSFQYISAHLDLFRLLHKAHPCPFPVIFSAFNFRQSQNQTLEEIDESIALKAKEEARKRSLGGPEKQIEKALGKQLEAQGQIVQYQVPCTNGIADIVTENTIYEVKIHLSKSNLQKAISQVLSYRACINPSAKAVVVGRKHPKQPIEFKIAQDLGVEIIVWDKDINETLNIIEHT